jgi:hypothetical protein
MIETRTIDLPRTLADRLEESAKAMGVTVAAYVEFLEQCRKHQLDAKFADAARYVFKNYPETLKKLAQ